MTAGGRGGRAAGRRAGLRVAVAQFALSALAVLVVIGSVGFLVLREAVKEEALRDATTLAEAVAQGVIQGALSPAVIAGDPAALAEFDATIRGLVLGDTIVRVKIWSRDGRVVYSDEPRQIGERFPVNEHLAETFATRSPHAEVSRLDEAENGFDRSAGDRLVEVYLPIAGPGGTWLAAETYQSTRRVDDGNRRILGRFAPVLLLALGVLALAQLPLAWWLARRIRGHYRERDLLARRAELAAERERRRIAHDLHDGVVQDLAASSFALAAAAGRVEPAAAPDVHRALERGARTARESVTSLRSLLVELYQKDDRGSLLEEIDAVAEPLRARLAVTVAVAPAATALPRELEGLVYRAAREALANVGRHARASRASVDVDVADGVVELRVQDDGSGLVGDGGARRAAGHLGLALLAETAAARGGGLEVSSEPGRGTLLVLRLPLEAPVGAPAGAEG